MAPRHFIALAGNIGTGKTTASELIADHFDYDLFREPVVDNRFLGPYYGDMKRWSFTLQMEFLFKRIDHHSEIERARTSCIQDRSLIEDPELDEVCEVEKEVLVEVHPDDDSGVGVDEAVELDLEHVVAEDGEAAHVRVP